MLTTFGDDKHDVLQASGKMGLPPHERLFFIDLKPVFLPAH
jgi:hypothetical protein